MFRLIHQTPNNIGFFLTTSGGVCLVRDISTKLTVGMLYICSDESKLLPVTSRSWCPLDLHTPQKHVRQPGVLRHCGGVEVPSHCGPPHMFDWYCGTVESVSTMKTLLHKLFFVDGRHVMLRGPLPSCVKIGSEIGVFNIRENYVNSSCVCRRSATPVPDPIVSQHSFHYTPKKRLVKMVVYPLPNKSKQVGRLVWTQKLIPCDEPCVVVKNEKISRLAKDMITKAKPYYGERPLFVCPLLYSWYDRTPSAKKIWISSGLFNLFGGKKLKNFIHDLVCFAFINQVDTSRYLEKVLGTFLIPLLGDGTTVRPKIEGEFERSSVIATLRAAGATSVAPYMTHALAGGQRCDMQMRLLEEASVTCGVKYTFDLRQGKWIQITVPKQNIKKWSIPIITKTEVVNLKNTQNALKRWQIILERLRLGTTPHHRHQAERAKKKVDFLTAILQAGTVDKTNNTLTNVVTYTKRTPVGRYVPKWPSLTQCPSDLRGTLCTQQSDIDITNCHPVLLQQIARRAGVPVPNLDQYVKERNSVIQEVSNHYGGVGKKWVKELFLRIINGGGLKTWIEKICDEDKDRGRKAKTVVQSQGHSNFVVAFRSEVSCLREVVIARQPGANEILEEVQRLRPAECRTRWSLFSWCLTEVESLCLLSVADYFERIRGIPVDTLVFDGAIIRSKSLNDTDLRECENHVFNQVSWKINLVHKPFPAETVEAK